MEELHVGRSAERLNLTASAVSHGLKRLRALLGDPLFLRTPRGVVPTDRANELAPAIADVLARIRSVLASAEPFDPARSTRRFLIAAPDGVAAVFLPPLLAALARAAPGIDIGINQLLPREGEMSPDLAWNEALAALDQRATDIAVIPHHRFPARFLSRPLFGEDFVVALRDGHPYAADPSLENYCAQKHLVVSHTADPHGFVDTALAARGLSRRVALTVPNFMLALATLADTDLVSALPRTFVATHAGRFGVIGTEPPFPLFHSALNIVIPHVAMMDAGLAWLVETLSGTAAALPPSRPVRSRRRAG
jgi:DNA-binding transcriptional LysR family regulator